MMEQLVATKFEGISQFFSFSNEDSMVICGVTNYTKHDCDISVACIGDRPPLRMGWRHLQKYVFDVCGCKRMTSKILASNKKALRMNRIGGLSLEGVMRKGDPETHEDIHVYSMLKEESRWASQ